MSGMWIDGNLLLGTGGGVQDRKQSLRTSERVCLCVKDAQDESKGVVQVCECVLLGGEGLSGWRGVWSSWSLSWSSRCSLFAPSSQTSPEKNTNKQLISIYTVILHLEIFRL